MELAPIIGLVLGIGPVLFGQMLEGGTILPNARPTAAIIVSGGKIGATPRDLISILQALKQANALDQGLGVDEMRNQ